MSTATFFLSFGLVLVTVVTGVTGQETDKGSTAALDVIRNELTNRLEQVGRLVPVEERIGAMALYEREVEKVQARGEITASEAAAERYRIARQYWDLRDFEDATRVGYQVIDESGDSLPAAKSWFMLGMMQYGNFQNPAGATDHFKSAREMLSRLSATSSDRELMSLRARVLSHGADVHRLTDDFKTAKGYLEEILGDPRVVVAAGPTGVMNTNLALARTLTELGEFEKAQTHYEKANEIATSSDAINSTQRLALQVEAILKKWGDVSNEERIKALEKLWNSELFKDEPQIFQVGNELTFYYFFRSKTPDKFGKIEEEFLRRIREFVAPERVPPLAAPTKEMLLSYYGQNLLLALESARLKRRTPDIEKIKKEFKDSFASQKFNLSLPPNSPREYAARVVATYSHFFGPEADPAKQPQGKLDPIPLNEGLED